MGEPAFLVTTMSVESFLKPILGQPAEFLQETLKETFPKNTVSTGKYIYLHIDLEKAQLSTQIVYSVNNLWLPAMPAAQAVPVRYDAHVECLSLVTKTIKVDAVRFKETAVQIKTVTDLQEPSNFYLELWSDAEGSEARELTAKIIHKTSGVNWDYTCPCSILADDSPVPTLDVKVKSNISEGMGLVIGGTELSVYKSKIGGVFTFSLPTVNKKQWEKILAVDSIFDLDVISSSADFKSLPMEAEVEDMGAIARRGVKTVPPDAVPIEIPAKSETQESVQISEPQVVENTDTAEDGKKKRRTRRTAEQVLADSIEEAKKLLRDNGYAIDDTEPSKGVSLPVPCMPTMKSASAELLRMHNSQIIPALVRAAADRSLDPLALEQLLGIIQKMLADTYIYVSKTNIPATASLQ